MAHQISFNPDSVRAAMNNLLVEMDNGGEGSLNNMPTNVRRYTINGQENSNGGIESLTNLRTKLHVSLSARSTEAAALQSDLVAALDALELIIADLNAREDDQSLKSAHLLENVQQFVTTSMADSTAGGAGGGSSNPTRDEINAAGGFETGDGNIPR
ncbi:hypothetical protein [Microbacterium sp. NC79]|uniref:hypothetical protein n=1 Tax=Microbacterium sp. NC79 TaxID=2851009 RepID=UPI001C2C516C|nr:hypothetical protein [Microbacterium sp. NC79]MBV0894045.1 hypothetical protein [Microbacterium sp. NC79]